MTDQRHTTAAADEAAIRDLIARQINSWNARDPVAYSHTYTPDGDCVSFVGGHHQGRAAIAASGEAPSAGTLFAKLLRGAQLDVEITDLRFLTPDVAVIHAHGGLVKPGRGPSRRTRRTNTSVAVRTEHGWLLAATHDSTQRRFAQKLLTAAIARRAAPNTRPDEESCRDERSGTSRGGVRRRPRWPAQRTRASRALRVRHRGRTRRIG